MRSLLGRMASSESPESIDKHGQQMANKIRTVQKNRKKMVTEELKAVIAERDAAVEKVTQEFFIVNGLNPGVSISTCKFSTLVPIDLI